MAEYYLAPKMERTKESGSRYWVKLGRNNNNTYKI